MKFLRQSVALSLMAMMFSPMFATAINGGVHPVAGANNRTGQSEPVSLRSTDKGDEFSILMPTQPTTLVTSLRITLKNDAVIDEDRSFAAYADRCVFLVRVLRTSNPRRTLDALAMPNEGGHESGAPMASQDITLGSFKGKQVDSNELGIQYKEHYHRRTQYFATAKKVFAISASARDESNPWLNQFFSTLKLGEMVYDARVTYPHQGEQSRTSDPATLLPPDTNQIFKPEQVTHKAVLVWAPVAPFMQVRHNFNFSNGAIKLEMVLSATGQITDIKVLKGLTQEMNEKVIEAVKYFKFIPAEKDGQPVAQWHTFEYRFDR
jgi:TonB family protein